MELTLIGLGLIGGSIALAAGRRGARVVAVDVAPPPPAPPGFELARIVDAADEARVMEAVAAADLVVLCTPIGAIMRALPSVLTHAKVVTDCGSTKRRIAEVAAACPRGRRFVPGHPMAGAPEGGLANARPELFEERRWIVCPEQSDADAVAAVERLIELVGARLVRMSVADHDRAVALTSHVPQLLASALTLLAERRGARVAEGPAFGSATRVAGGAPSMWRDIFETNADEIAGALRELCQELDRVAVGLAQPEPASTALSVLQQAREIRRSGAGR